MVVERRHLEYFLAIADHGSFGRAAVGLHVTQSALSQAIAQLERDLGTPLFYRNVRPVKLTPAGHSVLGPARQVLRDFSSVRAAVAETTGLIVGHLDVAALPTLSQWAATPLIAGFRSRYPGVSVHLVGPKSSRTAELAEMIRRGACEVGLTERGASTQGLVEIGLGNHDYVAVLPPKTKISSKGAVSLENVLSMGIIVGPLWETSRPFLTISNRCPELLHDSVVVKIDHREAYVPLVLSGTGAAILPRFVGEHAAAAGAVIAELDVSIVRELALVHRRGVLTSAAEAFCRLTTDTKLGGSATVQGA
ncbi:MAG: LysR family transcriptional regulator [Actinophytocola sp.]|nr:LysR family transcriptional regulator [Actinophytocola sp.]